VRKYANGDKFEGEYKGSRKPVNGVMTYACGDVLDCEE
jgi:hypothetical protein